MYEKYLTLVLLILASGYIMGTSFQYFNDHYILAQTNQAPEADDQEVSVDANDKVKITLEGKDDDKDDEIEFDIVSDPSHGDLDNFDKSDGSVTYTPENDYSGDDDFEFKVIDDKGAESNTADIKINVKPIEETDQEVAGETDQEVAGETDQEVAGETDQEVAGETDQEVAGETDQETQNQTTNNTLQSNEVNSINQSPIAYDQDLSTNANNKIDITLVGEDADNDPIQFVIVSSPTDATLDNFDMAKGTVMYAPTVDYVGNDSFAFKVIDDNGVESNSATVSVEVKEKTVDIASIDSANKAPTAFDQTTSVDKNNQLNITLTGEDADNDPIKFVIVSSPTDATLDNFDKAKGTVTYAPGLDYIGNDSFSFKVSDDKGVESSSATVSVEVKENNLTNQAPQAFDQVTNEANSTDYRYAVWSAGEEEDRFIFFSRSTDGGESFSSPLSLSGKSRSPVFNPGVSSAGNNVYVVWQGQAENGNQDIFMRKSVDYGSSFSEVENLSNDPGGSGNPEVTINGNITHVAWEGTTPGNNYIFYSKSDDGSEFHSPQKIGDNKAIPYNPELVVKDNSATDSFTYKAIDDNGAESNVATVDVTIDAIDQVSLEDEAKSISVDTSQEIDITLEAKDLNKDPILFELVTPPTEGRLDKFDPNSGKVTYVPNEDNKIDIRWHNYINGQDKILTKNIDDGDSTGGTDNSDPFKMTQ
jgi:hypothetical protein